RRRRRPASPAPASRPTPRTRAPLVPSGRRAAVAPVLDLLDDRPAQRRGERGHRQAVEHVLEEPEDDEPLGLRRWDAAALEVVALVVVGRAGPPGGGG